MKEKIYNPIDKTISFAEISKEEMQVHQEQAQKEYWQSVGYGEAINAEIRKKYTESQEFAILRQKDEKFDEYSQYYDYCEECKTFVKEQKIKYGGALV